VGALAAASVVLALLYVCAVRPGIPYDEPSHFQTIKYYAMRMKMPVLGEADVTYEGYQPPLYYAAAALIFRILRSGGEKFAFYCLRCAGIALMVPAVLLCHQIVRSIAPSRRSLPLITAVFLALNPSMLAIAASIQNDMLAIVLCLWVTHRIVTRPDQLSIFNAATAGLLTGLAILTKLSAMFMVPAVLVFVLRSSSRPRIWFALTFVVRIAAVSGWWFIRNRILYGDYTAAAALDYSIVKNFGKPMSVWHPHDLFYMLWSIITYLWLPVEYYRNLIHAPVWLRAVVATVTALSALGWLLDLLRRRLKQGLLDGSNAAGRFLQISYVLAVGLFVWTCLTKWQIGARVTLVAFASAAIVWCGGVLYISPPPASDDSDKSWPVFALAAVLLLSNAYVLVSMRHVAFAPFSF
jgi:4-amino-4-deoxy-L-arabinose transferase-like glycosyltransferase